MTASPLMQYDPRMVYTATRAFLFNGARLKPGDELPTTGSSAPPPSKVEVLLRTRFVRPDRLRPEPASKSKAASTPQAQSSAKPSVDTSAAAMPWSEVLALCKKHKVSAVGERHAVRKCLRAALE